MPQNSALDKIHELESQIVSLKQEAVLELRQKLAIARTEVSTLEKELAELTGSEAAAVAPAPRTRRPSISDEELKVKILQAMSHNGQHGMNAKKISTLVGQHTNRVRDFIKNNPKVLKRQGTGPGTRFFLP